VLYSYAFLVIKELIAIFSAIVHYRKVYCSQKMALTKNY